MPEPADFRVHLAKKLDRQIRDLVSQPLPIRHRHQEFLDRFKKLCDEYQVTILPMAAGDNEDHDVANIPVDTELYLLFEDLDDWVAIDPFEFTFIEPVEIVAP